MDPLRFGVVPHSRGAEAANLADKLLTLLLSLVYVAFETSGRGGQGWTPGRQSAHLLYALHLLE